MRTGVHVRAEAAFVTHDSVPRPPAYSSNHYMTYVIKTSFSHDVGWGLEQFSQFR